jgi:hypothetical protein
MCSTLLNFSLAHFIVKKMKKNIRPSFDVKNIKIHNILAILPLVSLTLANAFSCLSFVCSVIFVIGLFAPIANGFLTIYRFADKVNKNRTLISFYFALSVFTLPTIAVVIVLGVVDSFFPIARC